MQEVAVTRDSAGSNLTQMHNERKNNDEWGKLVHLQADMEKESVKRMKAQNDDIMKQLRYENGMINRAKMERERNLRSLDHSIDKDEAKDPKNMYSNNDYTSGKVLREKFKHKYIEDLNQQLEEKKLRKQREKLMDPREKIMNQKYMTDLANGKDANPNPILSNSHLKMKLDRNKSRDQMTLDNSMMYSPNTPLDGYTNSSHLVIPNRSKSNIRMNNFDTITPGNSTGRKDNLSRIALPQRKLIMNTGNNVLGNGSIHSSQVDRKIDRDSLKNYQAKNRRSNNQTFDSFGRLGFKDNTKNDPSFNPHYEYNLRKSPIGRSLNNSVDNIRMNDLKINNPTVRNKVQISKRASVEEMIKSRPQVDNISNLVFCQKQ